MDLHLLVPSSFHEKLKCSVCKNYLSYYPIFLCSNNESVCGRCTVPEGRISYQDEAFQTICQFLKFPCRYQPKGCPEELASKDVPEHEENCSYRVVVCFINEPIPCNKKGSLPTLLSHCQTDHSDMILKNGSFQIDLATCTTIDNLIEYDKQLLIFSRKFDSQNKMLECAIYHVPYKVEVESCVCQLIIRSNDKVLSFNLNTTSFKEMILTKLCLKSISEEGSTVLVGQINIGKDIEDVWLRIDSKTNLQLLSLLKCCECFDFAKRPIYHCVENMHTLCSVCKISHFRGCRPCTNSKEYRQRNLHLEKIADLVYYPCKYRQNGCTQSFKHEQFFSHHYFCVYGDDICPFFEFDLCKWKGLKKDVFGHLVKKHGDILSESSEVALVLSQEMKTPQCNIIRFSNRLFRLLFCVDEDERYMWSVEMIEYYEKGFKFAIDIVENEKRLFKSQDCCSLNKKSNLFKNMPYCYFLKDQIRGFAKTESNQVTFRVHIFK